MLGIELRSSVRTSSALNPLHYLSRPLAKYIINVLFHGLFSILWLTKLHVTGSTVEHGIWDTLSHHYWVLVSHIWFQNKLAFIPCQVGPGLFVSGFVLFSVCLF